MFQVPYVRLEDVERRVHGTASVGDSARAGLGPGHIDLLEARVAGGAIGDGYEAGYTIPYGLARTAAGFVVEPATPPGGAWTIRQGDLAWRRAARRDEALVARATLLSLQRGLATFDVSTHTVASGLILEGQLRLAATVGGRAYDARPTSGAGAAARTAAGSQGWLSLAAAPAALTVGRRAAVQVRVTNRADRRQPIDVRAHPPYGGGLAVLGDGEQTIELEPGEARLASFTICADRPDDVNLSRPWRLVVTARDSVGEEAVAAEIAVPDMEPGRTYYVLTEDCETFDGGPRTGDYANWPALGNANDVMDPEEYRIQMVAKPNRMNAIAERHGARWTHFWCAPQRFAADWAAGRSARGEWREVVAELDESIRSGSRRHEYAPHIHYDYEPDSRRDPQPRLVYDAATDGILPNDYYDPRTNPRHRWHDWDGAARGAVNLKALGDRATLDSKAGSLARYLRYLAALGAPHRYPLIARTGSFDFGHDPDDQRISTSAYELNGLRANSDAYRAGGGGELPANQMFWCRADDRDRPVARLEDARLVQLAVTHDTDFRSLDAVNAWFRAAHASSRGPGVRVISVMTHAMFMQGEPDPFRSLDGGSFDVLDRHLAWVRREYPDVRFATATDALIEFLDEYAPTLEAVVAPWPCEADAAASSRRHPVRLLGRGIRVDASHPAILRVPAPAFVEPRELASLRVFGDGRLLGEQTVFDEAVWPAVEARLTERPAVMTMDIRVRAAASASLPAVTALHSGAELPRPPLLSLRRDGTSYSMDVVRLLMNPVAGHDEPLGRRLHPLGAFPLGLAVRAVRAAEGGPVRLKVRWRRSAELEARLQASAERRADGRLQVRVHDETGATILDADGDSLQDSVLHR